MTVTMTTTMQEKQDTNSVLEFEIKYYINNFPSDFLVLILCLSYRHRKYGKAVFRWEKLGVDMAHDWNKASKQESFYEHRISQNSHDRSSRFS